MASPKSQPEDDLIEDGDSKMRLQQFLAAAGYGSRRGCEELILEGRVHVDEKPVKSLGIKVDPKTQLIELDGIRVKLQAKRYYIINKPKGVLCTNKDPMGRERVIDLFPKDFPRLFTVGRLDDNSEGLLLVTNDGEWAQQIAHPKFRMYRTYRVQVAGRPTPETLGQLRKGFYFREGKFQIHKIRQTGKKGKSTFLEVVLTEGQNREVRRLLARVGHKVMALQRVAFGPIKLGSLAIGKYRELHSDELATIQEVVERNVREAKESSTRSKIYRPKGVAKKLSSGGGPRAKNNKSKRRGPAPGSKQTRSKRGAARTKFAKNVTKRSR